MKYAFKVMRGNTLVQRAENDRLPTSAEPGAAAAPRIDMEDLVERVYRRWQDELRRERERGAW